MLAQGNLFPQNVARSLYLPAFRPDPIPPYYLRIYSSALSNTTDSFYLVNAGTQAATQLTIPFPPETLYSAFLDLCVKFKY